MKLISRHTYTMLMLIAIAAIGIICSCEKAENLYSIYRAYFRYNPVSAQPNLFRACTSLGEFCSITYPIGANSYVVKSPSNSSIDYIPRTAVQGYQNFILGVGGGLIVGLPIIPEMMEEESHITCYDLCCPNCYVNSGLCKHLTLHTSGTATCPLCLRKYDMNNLGIITAGDAGRSLFRYYASYYSPSQTLTIDNK